jgi:hypothetical protein
VVGLQIELNAGSFESISNVPGDWHVTIDNSSSGDARLEAHAESDAMALTGQQLLSVGVQIRRTETTAKKFQISGEYVLASDREQERRIPLGAYNFEFVERYPRHRLN